MKKFVSAMLAFVMIFTILPITTFAESNSITPNSTSVNVGIAKLATIKLKTVHSYEDYEYSVAYECDSDKIGISWGSWDGDNASLYITGLKSGTAKIKFYYDDNPTKILATVTVNVKSENLSENEKNLYVAAAAIKALKNTLYVPSSLKISSLQVAKGCKEYSSEAGGYVKCSGDFTGYSVHISYSASSRAGIVSNDIISYGVHLKSNYTYSIDEYHSSDNKYVIVNSDIASRYNIYGMIYTIYNISYDANGGNVSPANAQIESGKSVKLPTPTRSGNYTCLGWATSRYATSATYNCGASYKPNSNITLYAVWRNNSLKNGLVKENGKWNYYFNDEIDNSFTGMVKNDYGWWYVKNGTIDFSYDGMAKNQYGWFYMKSGKLDTTYTGMAKNQYGWYYMKNGKLDKTYTGMAQGSSGWMYVTKGELDTTYTGMAKNQWGWWYMKNGKLDTTYTGMAKNQYGWWYMKNGKLDTTFTGISKNQYGNWYMKKGKLDTTYNGVFTASNGNKWKVVNGKATKVSCNSSYTAVVKADPSLNIRENPDVNSRKIGSIKNGVTITVVAETGGWAKTTYNGVTGWVSKDYIKKK